MKGERSAFPPFMNLITEETRETGVEIALHPQL
jgi:hypothetical protein